MDQKLALAVSSAFFTAVNIKHDGVDGDPTTQQGIVVFQNAENSTIPPQNHVTKDNSKRIVGYTHQAADQLIHANAHFDDGRIRAHIGCSRPVPDVRDQFIFNHLNNNQKVIATSVHQLDGTLERLEIMNITTGPVRAEITESAIVNELLKDELPPRNRHGNGGIDFALDGTG